VICQLTPDWNDSKQFEPMVTVHCHLQQNLTQGHPVRKLTEPKQDILATQQLQLPAKKDG